jgi:hypothetical protein
MKKIIFISFLLFSLVSGLSAQTSLSLATFEESANDLLFLGDYTSHGDNFWYDSARFIEGGLPQTGTNPNKSGINTSDQCVWAINVADADWWGNFMTLGLSTPITITLSNCYLHFMAYRSIQPKDFCVGFNDRNESEGRVYSGKLKADGVWENVVVDLSSKIGEEMDFIGFILSANWEAPRTGWSTAVYAFDNFALSNSSLPPDVTLIDGSALHIGFESQSEINQWVQEFDLQNENNSAAIIDNPFTSSTVNSGGKILQFDKSDQASWWQGYRINFNGLMPVGDENPNYLHALIYVPADVLGEELSIDVQLCAKDHLGNENAELFTVWDDQVDEWLDLVMDINKIEYLKEVTVRYDLRKDIEDDYINSPANTFYLDEIVFNKDENARTDIETGVRDVFTGSFATVTTEAGAIKIRSAKNISVQLYNITGGLIRSADATGTVTLPVEKGIYIVKINSINGEQQITKIKL